MISSLRITSENTATAGNLSVSAEFDGDRITDNNVCITVRHEERPDHLFIGTPADNTLDMLRKGRGRGVAGRIRLLTDDDLRRIRARRRAGESRGVIARDFAIHPGTVTNITRGFCGYRVTEAA